MPLSAGCFVKLCALVKDLAWKLVVVTTMSSPGQQNVWHACQKWHARTFSWHATFNILAFLFATNLAILRMIYFGMKT
jgi:hypothetical protein